MLKIILILTLGINAPSLSCDCDKPFMSGFNFMKEIIIQSKKHGKKIVIVDDEDYNYLIQFKWYIWKTRNLFYVRRSVGINKIYMHRDIMGLNDSRVKADHIDHNGLNNQRSNLRASFHFQNMANQSNKNNSVSKYRGVVFDKRSNNWSVNLSKLGKRYYVGKFKTEIEAAIAYNVKAKEVHGEFAFQNIILPA